MSKNKISVTVKIAIILTIISVIPAIYMNTISDGYALYYGLPISTAFMGIGFLLSIFGFIFWIGGLIAAIKNRNNNGKIVCIICMFLNFIFIGYCLTGIDSYREPSRRISCASNMKQIHISLKQYAADYSGNFPPANGAAGLEYLRKYDYLTDYSVYACPSTMTTRGQNNQPLTEENVDYVYIGGLNKKSDPNALILYDKPNNHEFFGNVGAVDGTIKGIYGNPWTEKIRK